MVDVWRDTVPKEKNVVGTTSSPLNLGPGAPSLWRDVRTKIRALPRETSGDEVLPVEGIAGYASN